MIKSCWRWELELHGSNCIDHKCLIHLSTNKDSYVFDSIQDFIEHIKDILENDPM